MGPEYSESALESQSPIFLQAMGWIQKKRAGRTLEGRTWDEMPVNVGFGVDYSCRTLIFTVSPVRSATRINGGITSGALSRIASNVFIVKSARICPGRR